MQYATEKRVLQGKTILVIDDEEPIRSLIRAYLSQLNVNIITVESPVEARVLLKNSIIDIILSD